MVVVQQRTEVDGSRVFRQPRQIEHEMGIGFNSDGEPLARTFSNKDQNTS